MSLTSTPNFNDYINRVASILQDSAVLFPKSVGNNLSKSDLVKQVIPYKLPVPELPVEGPGPPHVFIDIAENSVLTRQQVGRSSRDIQGPERLTLELYIVVVTHGKDFRESQTQMYDIVAAITSILDKNKRLVDSNGANPLCAVLQWILVPWILNGESTSTLAKNILVRAEVFVNLR